jgi:hypothetical protein
MRTSQAGVVRSLGPPNEVGGGVNHSAAFRCSAARGKKVLAALRVPFRWRFNEE